MLLKVQGVSMLPTLGPGDRIVVKPLAVDASLPSCGSIVVVWHPWKSNLRLIKRLHKVDRNGMILLGDNLSASTDSRQLGAFSPKAVVGVVVSKIG
ncbi:nickel-type superoxide dismutase maturation protease [Synechococcus sp. M16CYN]|uniref:nickel-type superoxide dismutase maturation protease n=1 Tax=Synechococcus sp. M16CYN TaxID=3103139 RepID=UPI00333F2564